MSAVCIMLPFMTMSAVQQTHWTWPFEVDRNSPTLHNILAMTLSFDCLGPASGRRGCNSLAFDLYKATAALVMVS
jgi:heat shock protein HslJ